MTNEEIKRIWETSENNEEWRKATEIICKKLLKGLALSSQHLTEKTYRIYRKTLWHEGINCICN